LIVRSYLEEKIMDGCAVIQELGGYLIAQAGGDSADITSINSALYSHDSLSSASLTIKP